MASPRDPGSAARTLCLYSSFHGLTRGDPGAGSSVHIWSSTSRTCPSLLFNTNWSPLFSFNRASRAALVQLPPPLLIHRLRNPPTSSPSASSVIRLISTTGCDHSGGENRRRASSAGYLGSYHNRIHLSSAAFLIHTCVSIREHQLSPFLLLSGYQHVNVGLTITAMTGKLAEKLPLTMSSLINTIPDSLYPEEDIPTSMNIFTNTESISHYSQMNTGELFLCFSPVRVRGGNSCARLQHLFALRAVALQGGFTNLLFLWMKSNAANSGLATPLKAVKFRLVCTFIPLFALSPLLSWRFSPDTVLNCPKTWEHLRIGFWGIFLISNASVSKCATKRRRDSRIQTGRRRICDIREWKRSKSQRFLNGRARIIQPLLTMTFIHRSYNL